MRILWTRKYLEPFENIYRFPHRTELMANIMSELKRKVKIVSLLNDYV